MKFTRILCILSTVLLLSSCQSFGLSQLEQEKHDQHETPEYLIQEQHQSQDKKVILIILDSMIGPILDASLERGNVPALQFLIDNGRYYDNLITPFPSMSVTVESSLVTGTMPDKHGVPGLSWYSKQEDRIVNYGTSFLTWLKTGLAEGVMDVLYHLNNTHLSPATKTIFEELHELGKTSGSVNALVYRGPQLHSLHFPRFFQGLINVPNQIETYGPDILAFGAFTQPNQLEQQDYADEPWNSLGLTDTYSTEVVTALIREGKQPDFLLVFLPDLDKIMHKHGPYFRKGFERAEKHIHEILDAYPSWEHALEHNVFIIIGDHGQDKIMANEESLAIDLLQIYREYKIPALHESVSYADIAFGINQRMTYVYDVQEANLLPELEELAKQDDRIAMVAWVGEEDWIKVTAPLVQEPFYFKPGGEWIDPYNQHWFIKGDSDVINMTTNDETKELQFTDYPDALNQLYSALKSHGPNHLILVARPGYSFQAEGTPIHPDGGEHGGLHKNDAQAAMVIAGTDKLPQYPRIVDLKDYIIQLFQ